MLVANPHIGALAFPGRVIPWDGPVWGSLFADDGPSIDLVHALVSCDCVVAYLTSPSVEVEQRLRDSCPGDVLLADPRPPETGHCHISSHLLAPLRGRVAVADPLPRIRAPLPTLSEPRSHGVIVHPGGGGQHKCWPASRFAELIAQLCDHGADVAVLLGPVEADRGIGSELAQRVPVFRPQSPLKLAARLASAKLFVGNDSGPGHVAAAVGTPVITLFGPTQAPVWRPIGRSCRVIRAPDGDLATIEVSEVRDLVLNTLERLP
ncbi:MAG: glycosyltransferase family 9 protein [Candidatus Latescibacterota bacterium]|nr:glycosyltransferase family 9 protein [Candidatus Latescibacterota bacterium]